MLMASANSRLQRPFRSVHTPADVQADVQVSSKVRTAIGDLMVVDSPIAQIHS